MRGRGHSDNGLRQDKHAGMQPHRGKGTQSFTHSPYPSGEFGGVRDRVARRSQSKKEVYCASNCHIHKHVYSHFGISFAVLASISISNTAFTFLSFTDSLQSKLAMALVSLFIVAAFFYGDSKPMAIAVRKPMVRIVSPTVCLIKELGHVAIVHATGPA